MLATALTRAQRGIEAPLVIVETHFGDGVPKFNIVGLPETAIKESQHRVRAALESNHFDFPSRVITVNLAPGNIPKTGSQYDLAIALTILGASHQLPMNKLKGYEFFGELGLTGELRPISGVLPAAVQAKKAGNILIIPTANAAEAALAKGEVLAANHLMEIFQHFISDQKLPFATASNTPLPQPLKNFSDIKGQLQAKRAMTIAAAGGHHILLQGPPGTGKTMLAERFNNILPPLTEQQVLEVASVYSISQLKKPLMSRPFRSPHHTASAPALTGGSNPPKPGEISLSHHGVLFLDELPEFNRHVIESLREPLESGKITISRAACQVDYPARFQLIAAMNPCPCGYAGDVREQCRCTFEQIQRYKHKLSGPFLDRIDITVDVPRLSLTELDTQQTTENSERLQELVVAAQTLQRKRQNCLNHRMSSNDIKTYANLSPKNQQFFATTCERLGISLRKYFRLLKVARTIADLEQSRAVEHEHLTEALCYR